MSTSAPLPPETVQSTVHGPPSTEGERAKAPLRPTQASLSEIMRFARSFARVTAEQRRPLRPASLHRV